LEKTLIFSGAPGFSCPNDSDGFVANPVTAAAPIAACRNFLREALSSRSEFIAQFSFAILPEEIQWLSSPDYNLSSPTQKAPCAFLETILAF
jgi:hypothetical protein